VSSARGTSATRSFGSEPQHIITMTKPTPKMIEPANGTGVYRWRVDGRDYPKAQIVSIQELLDGRRPSTPPPLSPYTQAAPSLQTIEQPPLG
jgi:hypothetical protein